MPKTRIPSPARSQGAPLTPRRRVPRSSRSVGSPACSNASGRLTSLVKDQNMDSFALSPFPGRRSVLTDNTDIEEPRRGSWWKKLSENSRDIIEVFEDNKVVGADNIVEEYFDIEVLSQENKNYTADLPESSGSESIISIVLPQRKLFTQKERQPQKKFGNFFGNRESLAKLHNNNTGQDKTINAGIKNLFQSYKPRSKPVFPSALLNISPNKTTTDNTKEIPTAPPKNQNIFGHRPVTKRKNVFAGCIMSDSDDEIPEIQPKVFGFPRKSDTSGPGPFGGTRETSPTLNFTNDIEMDDWKLIPSSTMVDNQLENTITATPVKRTRLSRLSEAKESQAGTNKTVSSNNTSKTSNNKVEVNTSIKNKSKTYSKINKSRNKTISEDTELNKSLSPTKVAKNQNVSQNKSQTRSSSRNRNASKQIDQAMAANEGIADLDDTNQEDEEVNFTLRYENDEHDSIIETNATQNIVNDKSKNLNIKNNSVIFRKDNADGVKEILEHNISNNKSQQILAKIVAETEDSLKEKEEMSTDLDQVVEENVEGRKVLEKQLNNKEVNQEIAEECMETGNNEQTIGSDEKVETNQQVHYKSVIKSGDLYESVVKQVDDIMDVDDHNEDQQGVSNESQDKEEEMEQVGYEPNESQELHKEDKDNVEESEEVQNESEENEEESHGEHNESQEHVEESQEVQNDSDEEVEASPEAQNDSAEYAEESQEARNDSTENFESSKEARNDSDENDEESQEAQNDSDENVEENQEAQNDSDEHVEEKQEAESDSDENVVESQEAQNDSDEIVGLIDNEEEIEENQDIRNEIGVREEIEKNQEDSDGEYQEIQYESEDEIEIEGQEGHSEDVIERTETPDTDEAQLNSPEAVLQDKTNQMYSFSAQERNRSLRRTKSLHKSLFIRPGMASLRESAGFADGTGDSSAGSGWDSHRVTRKTMRQTFGKDFTPRKSLRALVMEKSAKRQTAHEPVNMPQANSTELPHVSDYCHADETSESDDEASRRIRGAKLQEHLRKLMEQNKEQRIKMAEAVKNSLKAPPKALDAFKVPSRPAFMTRRPAQPKLKPKTDQKKSSMPIDDLPPEFVEDMKYKPPKRFRPSNASWLTKRLYKYLETKLEPRYDYKARVRAEKLAETIYNFTKEARRHRTAAPPDSVDLLKHEMARLDIVKTHFEFYQFFSKFMPKEIRIKVIPDIVNKIPMPRNGIFNEIIL